SGEKMSLPLWQAVACALLAAIAANRQFQGWMYFFQLDEYLPSRLWPTARRRLAAHWPWQLGLLLAGLVLAATTVAVGERWQTVPLMVSGLLPLAFFRPFATRSHLKWTGRVRRLVSISGLLCFIVLVMAFWSGPAGAVLMGLIDISVVAALSLAALIARPYESRRRRHFMSRAEARLAAAGPLVVGITGSYGKTTTKVLLAQLLNEPDKPSFATPESYNTTLGVCRAINEGSLPERGVAIVEMGAYRPGEIAEICSFSRPRVGIVTAVGLMHLERFGSRQRIAQAKSELLAALPSDGFAVVPSKIAERDTLLRNLRARLVSVGAPGDRWWVEDEELTAAGTAFRLRGSSGEDVRFQVALYGPHLVADLLYALAAAAELGRPLGVLAERAAQLRGAPHRLEVSQHGGVTIIDDGYNSNPAGAAAALRLLAALPGGRRVLVTPGFIELGPEQEQRMRELGRRAAAVCTHVILVGPRHSAAVAQGLAGAGYPSDRVSVVADLAEAQLRLPEVAGAGSVVLFENDLPDSYLERR
ncbi:MAG: Mur ligase family protein, partial [Candidatus Dormibacteria bacterium]